VLLRTCFCRFEHVSLYGAPARGTRKRHLREVQEPLFILPHHFSLLSLLHLLAFACPDLEGAAGHHVPRPGQDHRPDRARQRLQRGRLSVLYPLLQSEWTIILLSCLAGCGPLLCVCVCSHPAQ